MPCVSKPSCRHGIIVPPSLICYSQCGFSISHNSGQNISGKLYFFCEIAPYGKSSISVFQEFFASIDKMLILGARPSTRL